MTRASLAAASCCLLACHWPLRASTPVQATVSAVEVSFSGPEHGQLDFTVEVADAAGAEVSQLSWELWLGTWRFATGVEGQVLTSPGEGGRLRCSVAVPLLARHVGWRESPDDVELRLRGDVRLTGARNDLVTFERRALKRLTGRPVREDAP